MHTLVTRKPRTHEKSRVRGSSVFIAPYVKVKAAGGMKTKADLFAFLEVGADRLGTSSGIKLLNE